MLLQVGQISRGAGQKIIQRNYAVALIQQALAHVRPNKAGRAGNDDPQKFLQVFILAEANEVHMLQSELSL